MGVTEHLTLQWTAMQSSKWFAILYTYLWQCQNPWGTIPWIMSPVPDSLITSSNAFYIHPFIPPPSSFFFFSWPGQVLHLWIIVTFSSNHPQWWPLGANQKLKSLRESKRRLCSSSGLLSQFSSVTQSRQTLCDPMDCSMPSFPVHHQLTELTQILVHRVGDAIQPSHPLLSILLPPSIFPSIRVFSSESILCIRWPKYWSFSFSLSPSNEYSGLISFRMDWLDLLPVQGTFTNLLQHHSSKASIFWCSAFFIVQLSHSYMTTGKTIALTKQTFVGKVMPLLFNMLSRLVIAFLPRSKHLLISWL